MAACRTMIYILVCVRVRDSAWGMERGGIGGGGGGGAGNWSQRAAFRMNGGGGGGGGGAAAGSGAGQYRQTVGKTLANINVKEMQASKLKQGRVSALQCMALSVFPHTWCI